MLSIQASISAGAKKTSRPYFSKGWGRHLKRQQYESI